MGEWNSMKTLDKYVHDYMVKKNMTRTAEIFAREANVAPTEVAIDHPDGFLSEWWSIFWDVFKSRLQNHQGNGEGAEEATENAAQSASPMLPVPDPLMFGNMLQGLISTMPLSEMNQQTLSMMQHATASLAMNQQTVSVMPPSIPNLAMNQQTLSLLQQTFPNSVMNQQATGVMQPSSSILNPATHQQAMGVMLPPSSIANPATHQQAMGVMLPPSSVANPAMNQHAMGMMPPPSSVPLSKPAMVVRIPPRSTSMNQQSMGFMQGPSPIPTLDQQAMGSMRPPSSIPMNQHVMGVMQPPSSTVSSVIHQQMLAQIPEEMRGEPVSILLAKMYEQDCLRRSARELAAKAQQLDAVKMNPMFASSSNPPLASSSRSSYLPQQNAENIQQWLARDKSPMNYERPKAVVPTSRVAVEAEIPDAGNNKGIQQIPVTRHYLTGAGLVSPGLRNHFPPSQGHHTTSVGFVSPGLGNQVSNPLGSLPNQQQQFAPSGGNRVDTLPAVAVQKSENLMSSASQSSHDPMFIDDSSGKDLQNSRKRKKESSSSAVDIALDGKEAEKEKSADEDIEAYFSKENDKDDDNMASLFSAFQQNSLTHFTSEPQGFSFKEVGSLHSANNKLLSCHFSTSGKLLAAAGHEKKVLLWDMENYSLNSVSGHSDIVTDVRFQPNSTVFGTSSFDKTVLIWDANKRSKPLINLTGHSEHVYSLDFHPRKLDLICSCDSGKEIRFWNISKSSCSHISKGAGIRARFQPRLGELLAAVMGNSISLIDLETNRIVGQLEGHSKDIRSFCWSSTGKYIAAVSEDSARIWSINSGGHCLHTFQHTGNTFESCTFHPGYSQLLLIGSNQFIHLWNPTENNRTWSYEAHESKIAALADSPSTETIASAGDDQWLKVWK